MVITENTKISQLIKDNPKAIEAIASINSHFNKLRNPFLRKILASRVTIKEAAKIGGSSISEFFKKLSPLGFEVESEMVFLKELKSEGKKSEQPLTYTKSLDVRDDLKAGKDPFQKIKETVTTLAPSEILLLINSFEPVPLIKILEKKGFTIEVDQPENDLVHTFIQRKQEGKEGLETQEPLVDSLFFDNKLKQVKGLIECVDVRNMEMPLPMVTVLERLEQLDAEDGLYVHHFKIPHFLLEELRSRGYSYLITQEGDDIFLLITKNS